MNWLKRKREYKKLINYRERIRSVKDWPEGYMDYHQVEMEMLEWLIASYENRAGDPKEYLEALIRIKYLPHHHNDYVNDCISFHSEPLTEEERFRRWNRQIDFLYHWVYYKKIVNF